VANVLGIEELEKDLETLMAQANQIGGAINYVQQKIAQLTRPEEPEPETEK